MTKTTDEDARDPINGGSRLRRLIPITRHDYWAAVMFLLAVLQLLLLRGLSIGAMLLFLFPPTAAFLFHAYADRKGSRVVASVFLTLIGIGVTVARVDWLFPEMGGVDARLPREADRILTWYTSVYLLFVFGLLPLFLFIRSLVDHHRKRPAQFSRPTCVLGLIAALLMAPILPVVCIGLLTGRPDEPPRKDAGQKLQERRFA